MAGIFLSAEWRYLVMLNYAVDPSMLQPHMPRGLESDSWQGKTFVSLVAFLFLGTELLGLRIPFHSRFEELNLRFYVRRRGEEGWRKGVVFIKEVVPKPAVALLARCLYHENYVCLPMRHDIQLKGQSVEVKYAWRVNSRWHHLGMKAEGIPRPAEPESLDAFITGQYWGYSAGKDGSFLEYRVGHPPWRIWPAKNFSLECDLGTLYGPSFKNILQSKPASAFLAEGSLVDVYRGIRYRLS